MKAILEATEFTVQHNEDNPYIYNRYLRNSLDLFLIKHLPGIKEFYHNKKYSLQMSRNINKYMLNPTAFQVIEIETVNRCNGTCEFCPVNKNVDPRPFKRMEENLFFKIINELSETNWKGFLALHSNNEPFIDQRMDEFIKYARKKLPEANIYLYTNGSLLTVDKMKDILPYISRIFFDNYDDRLILKPEIQKLYDYCLENKVDERKVFFMLRKEHEILSSRGGEAPNKREVKVFKAKCLLPYLQIVIRPDGKVSLCCSDVYGKYTMGDVNTQSLKEIWFSQQYKEIRSEMHKNGRKNLPLCKNCDTTHGIAF